MLPCRSLARYASTSKEKLSTILHSFHIVSHEIGLFPHDPQQWEFLAQSKRQRCFIQDVLYLIQASHRLSNYKALWLVVPKSVPHFLVGQEKGKGYKLWSSFSECRVYETPYHKSLSIEEKQRIDWMLFDASCATKGVGGHVTNNTFYVSDFEDETSDSEHSALSDEDVFHYGSTMERDGYGRWHKINRETSVCKGPCGRELPRRKFKLDAHRHRYKICWECHFIQDLIQCPHEFVSVRT